jgi:magnesium-transporting ATPase (P-type)
VFQSLYGVKAFLIFTMSIQYFEEYCAYSPNGKREFFLYRFCSPAKKRLSKKWKDTARKCARLWANGKCKESQILDFLRCLTTCHTVVRENDGTYRSESPDELALIEGIGKFNCRLLKRGTASMCVELMGQEINYDIRAVNAFNADRKRMSVLLYDSANDKFTLMCKGADNIMLPLCNQSPSARKSTEKSLLDLACMGLRTLCIASKEITKEEASPHLETLEGRFAPTLRVQPRMDLRVFHQRTRNLLRVEGRPEHRE